MSLIALRQILRRRGRQAAMVLVALSLMPLAAHHAGVTAAGAGGPPAHQQMAHGGESPAAPVTSVEQAVAVCLAILQMLLALILGLAALHWLGAASSRKLAGEKIFVPRGVLCRTRDGPAVLGVMRC